MGSFVSGSLTPLEQLYEIRSKIEELLQAGEPPSSEGLIELCQRHDDTLAAISEHTIVPVRWDDDWSWRHLLHATAPNPPSTSGPSVPAPGKVHPPAAFLRAKHSLLRRSLRVARTHILSSALILIALIVLVFTALHGAG